MSVSLTRDQWYAFCDEHGLTMDSPERLLTAVEIAGACLARYPSEWHQWVIFEFDDPAMESWFILKYS